MSGTAKRREAQMEQELRSLSYRYRKAGGPDNKLITEARTFAQLPENDDICATTSCRKFFTRALRMATCRATRDDIAYFEQLISRAKETLLKKAS